MESGARPELSEGRDPQALPRSREPWRARAPKPPTLSLKIIELYLPHTRELSLEVHVRLMA